MNKKTKRHTRRHTRGHNKRHNKTHRKRHLYRKHREIVSLPGSKGLPVFLSPDTKQSNKIYVNNDHKISGNIIPGLREYQM
jgi:hypothetical protein